MRVRSLVGLLCLWVFWPAAASAQTAMIPTQSQNTRNSEVTSAAGAPVSVALAAPQNTRVHLYTFAVRCSAGSAAVTVTDTISAWSSDAAFAGTSTRSATWMPAWTGGTAKTVTVTLGSCGGANVGTLTVQADIF